MIFNGLVCRPYSTACNCFVCCHRVHISSYEGITSDWIFHLTNSIPKNSMEKNSMFYELLTANAGRLKWKFTSVPPAYIRATWECDAEAFHRALWCMCTFVCSHWTQEENEKSAEQKNALVARGGIANCVTVVLTNRKLYVHKMPNMDTFQWLIKL